MFKYKTEASNILDQLLSILNNSFLFVKGVFYGLLGAEFAMAEPEGNHGQGNNLGNKGLNIGITISTLSIHSNILILELFIILIIVFTVSVEEHFGLLF